MKNSKKTYINNILFPCFIFSFITGMFTGLLIFLFKISSSHIMKSSANIYNYVRQNPKWLPCLLASAIVLGLTSALILKYSKNCRGGGIPTSVAILRGLIEFKWLKNIICLFSGACITFLGGIPLGNEGPSVQMGTAAGRGTIRIFAKNHKAWDRYIMTGGACGGFAVATGAPLTGIFFAFEEAHRRFSPMLFMTSAMTVTSATATMRLLCSFSNASPYMFNFPQIGELPLKYLWIAVVIGVICGFLAVLFTKVYSGVGSFISQKLQKLPFTLKVVFVFVIIAFFGFICDGFIGSGHSIIHELSEGHGVWYLIILYFCVRALFLMFANHIGISGGIFVPTLTFGALIGALLSQAAVQTELLPQKYFLIPIIVGMASFLASSSRTPITAITFALEALSGISNILPIAIGVTLSFLVIETCGITSLHDIVITKKVAEFNKGKTSTVVDSFVTVKSDSFAVGKEPRDILWPPYCTVLSVKKPDKQQSTHEVGIISEGDILHIHYQTHDKIATLEAIQAIAGTQEQLKAIQAKTVDESNYIVPEV